MFKRFASKVRQRMNSQYKKVSMGVVGAFAFAFVLAFGGATPTHAAAVVFTGTTLPFTVPDMLGTAVNFLTMYGEWVLLALGVLFAPVLYGLAMKLVKAVRGGGAKA
jgi:hypothetical protein